MFGLGKKEEDKKPKKKQATIINMEEPADQFPNEEEV